MESKLRFRLDDGTSMPQLCAASQLQVGKTDGRSLWVNVLSDKCK
jgi:hypothetical protein